MYLVRSIVKAQPGRRDELVSLYKEFSADMKAGENQRVLTASIGPSDSEVVHEGEVASLADFEARLAHINSSDKMAKYGPKFMELSVPGSHRFEIYRLHK